MVCRSVEHLSKAVCSDSVAGFEKLNIERTSTAVQIAEALHDMIVRGELEPGSSLNESVLSRQLAVSRNTVREAVRVLGRSGLIEQEMHRGAIVRPVDIDEVLDLYRAREILELTAIRSTGRQTDLEPVERALADFNSAAHGDDEARTIEKDLGFHGAIVGLLGSSHLDRYFAELSVELRFYLAIISQVDREADEPEVLIEQHAAVLRALRDGEKRAAARLLTEHIRMNAERVSTVLSERGSES